MIKKLVAVGSGVGASLLAVGGAFAQTPSPYAVDSASQTAVTDLISGLITGLLGVIPTALTAAAPFLVTLVVIFFLWKLARHFIGQ